MRPDRHAGAPGWHAGIFGLDVRGSFRAPGVDDARGAGARPVEVRLVRQSEIDANWPDDGAVRVVDRRYADGEPLTTIDYHPHGGYRTFAASYGTFVISSTADHIDCAPLSREPEWRWQRWLLGQLLPVASVLNGHEVLHASAVAIDGHAVAFVAGTGVGKSSLALNLVLRGHSLMADDVVAVSLRGGAPVAHPGPAVAKLRHAEMARIGARLAALGGVIGPDDDGVRLVVERESRARPLAALYLLDRVRVGEAATFRRIDPDFRLLLANSFDFLVTSPERMRRQLEIFAALADSVPVFRVSVPPTIDADGLASSVVAHLRDDVTISGRQRRA